MYNKIGIIGFGIMGSGIAQVCLEKGYEVIAVEQEESFFTPGLEPDETKLAAGHFERTDDG